MEVSQSLIQHLRLFFLAAPLLVEVPAVLQRTSKLCVENVIDGRLGTLVETYPYTRGGLDFNTFEVPEAPAQPRDRHLTTRLLSYE